MVGESSIVYWCVGEAGSKGAGLIPVLADRYLSAQELSRFTQMRFPKRRDEWLVGRITAKSLLTQCVPELSGVNDRRLTIANRPEGAPYVLLDGEPLPLQLSLSHREGLAAAAVVLSNEVGLGIDLEWVEDRDASFYADYFTTGEVRLLNEFSSDQTAWAGTLIWSAKEAMLKALGLGLRVDTRSVEILRIANEKDDDWGQLELNVPGVPDSHWHGFWRRSGNHILTMALTGAPGRPVIKYIGS